MSKTNNVNTNLKSFVRLALILVLILLMGLLFLYTWLTVYNKELRFPYVMKGNVFLMLVYMAVLYVFMLIYDCNNISVHRVTTLIFSESLACISTNILVYLVMIIPAVARGLMPFKPIIFMTILDILVISLWSYVATHLLRFYFPLKPMLLISNNQNIDKELYKFSKRKDVYNIKEAISSDIEKSELLRTCDKYEEIIIGDVPSEDRNDIIKHCFNSSSNVYVIPKLSDILLKYSDDIFTFDTPVYFSTNFGLSLESKIFKRIFDIVVSLVVILVFMPIWIIIALLIKIEDGGPIFFTQERATIDNNLFDIIKFRSMKVGSDKLGVLPTIEGDTRITKIGVFIRRFHIDEMPQFINVLLGDMSVVGPRPERIEHVLLYQNSVKEFAFRSKVKAGITGLAQIYGKYNTSAIDKLKLDLIYIKSYSIMLDIELLLRTLKVFIIKDNTEGFDEATKEYINNNATK